jgi:D-3-phosphoglycerate dehydrogenase
MKVFIRAPFHPETLERLRNKAEVIYENWMEGKDGLSLLKPEEWIERIEGEDIEIVVVEADFLFRDVIEKASKLKFIGTCRADTNLIDVEAATQHGIVVVNSPARNDVAVAELAVGLMLSLIRNIPKSHSMVSSGSWVDPTAAYFTLRGTELTGKTVGIVGFGAIGKRVARMLKGFDTRVLAYDPYVSTETFAEFGVTPSELDELMSQSDFVTLHCITNEGTAGLIDARRIALMKPTAYLINAASTYVIDMDAIAQALREKSIAGAGFDVYESWPVSADSPLLELDNVVLTPHIGGASYETIIRYSNMVADDVERFIKGERPKNLINPQVWDNYGQ